MSDEAPLTVAGPYFDVRIDYQSREIAVHGELDAATASCLGTAVAGLQRAADGDITVRLGEVTFLDMAGLGALVGARSAQAARGHGLSVVKWSQHARRLAELAAVEDLFASSANPKDEATEGGVDDARDLQEGSRPNPRSAPSNAHRHGSAPMLASEPDCT